MISSGVLIRLSRYSKKNVRPKARKLPAMSASDRFSAFFGDTGVRGRSASSTTLMLLVLSSVLTPVSFARWSRLS